MLKRFQTWLEERLTKGPSGAAKKYDDVLLRVILFLLAFSLVMVYSASITVAERLVGSMGRYYFLVHHAISIAIALFVGLIAVNVPMRIWEKQSSTIFLTALFLLLLVLIPGIGRVVNGSRRWLPLFFFNLQPSELMKFAATLWTANYLVRHYHFLGDIKKGFFPIFCVLLCTAVLLLLEPDFGALVVIAAIIFCLSFLGGLNRWVFAGSLLFVATSFALLIVIEPYRMRRMLGFIDPFADPYDKGYQLTNSLIAFGLGKWFGVGLGGSVQKLAYLPEPHTDFIMAVVAEELGLFGVCFLIMAYVWITYRAFWIGEQARKLECYYSSFVAKGIGIWIGLQAFINIGVSMGILPTKGMTMPFMSFGGSAMVATILAICVLLRIDWENRRIMYGYYKKA